ncbi:MAG: GNAT family N-acetyltransferase [Planctomycetota bacterium]
MLAQFHAAEDSSDIWLTAAADGLIGVAYLAPERMTVSVWNLQLIAVRPDRQRAGLGRELLNHVETLVADRGGRLLLVETSGVDEFAYVHSFYRTSGFHEEARIRDFYASGDDKVVFRKALEKSS